MRLIFIFPILLLLISCTNIDATESVVVVTNAIPVSTALPPSPVASLTPSSVPRCEPLSVEFCITEGNLILQRPIHAPANDLVDGSYRYGSTANGTRDPHHGVEFGNPSGTPVYAAADGVVVFAGTDEETIYSPWTNFYGHFVVIRHDEDLYTLYAHLSRTGVQSGQSVSAGEKIGEVGMTGVAIGSHLHFEVRRGNGQDYFATQNPELWLTPEKDINGASFGTLTISVLDQNHELVDSAGYTIRYYPDDSGKQARSYYGATYPAEMLTGVENLALGDLQAGNYRIAIQYNGKVYERWVEVESGKLTEVVILVR